MSPTTVNPYEAPKLSAQRTLGRGGGNRDLANGQVHSEIVPHETDGLRDGARNYSFGVH